MRLFSPSSVMQDATTGAADAPPSVARYARKHGRARRRRLCLLCACVLVLVPAHAAAFDFSAGVGLGGILAGTQPHLAVSPHVGVSWPLGSVFRFAAHDMFSILAATNKDGVGVHNETSVALGVAWEKGSFNLGPSLSIFSMPACRHRLCGRVVGLAPGGHAQVNVFVAGPLGVSVSASVEWLEGRSLIFPGGVAAMVVAGPMIRWQDEVLQ